MATNKATWLRNIMGASGPLVMRGNFAAGASQAIKKGEILELTGNTNTEWVPLDSDFAGDGNVAVANEEIKAGDRAGYYEIIVPRPGDVFEFALASASDVAVGDLLYYSTSQILATTGTYPVCVSVGQANYPDKQGHLADDASGDAGTTLLSTSWAEVVFYTGVSWWAEFDGTT